MYRICQTEYFWTEQWYQHNKIMIDSAKLEFFYFQFFQKLFSYWVFRKNKRDVLVENDGTYFRIVSFLCAVKFQTCILCYLWCKASVNVIKLYVYIKNSWSYLVLILQCIRLFYRPFFEIQLFFENIV